MQEGRGKGHSEVTFLPLTFLPRVDLAENIEWKRKVSTSRKICNKDVLSGCGLKVDTKSGGRCSRKHRRNCRRSRISRRD